MAKFVWYDVMTTDCKAAAAFYENVVGWNVADASMPGSDYTIFSMGPTMVAGAMPIPPEGAKRGMVPCWTGYIGVDDVDTYASRVTAAGGSIRRPPEDIPGVGRFAVVADPHGAGFILFTPNRDGEPGEGSMSPGRIGWHELHAGDGESAFAFYSALFGWTKGDAMDMGALGTYQMFAADGGIPIGGMMTKTPDHPMPYWLYYFNVEGIDAAVERIGANHGVVVQPPHEVPGGSWIVQGLDPQGATFALVAPKR